MALTKVAEFQDVSGTDEKIFWLYVWRGGTQMRRKLSRGGVITSMLHHQELASPRANLIGALFLMKWHKNGEIQDPFGKADRLIQRNLKTLQQVVSCVCPGILQAIWMPVLLLLLCQKLTWAIWAPDWLPVIHQRPFMQTLRVYDVTHWTAFKTP